MRPLWFVALMVIAACRSEQKGFSSSDSAAMVNPADSAGEVLLASEIPDLAARLSAGARAARAAAEKKATQGDSGQPLCVVKAPARAGGGALRPRSQGITSDSSTWEDDGRVIDVMILYTALAKRDLEADGFNVNDAIHDAVRTANKTFQNNGIELQVRLVYSGLTVYVEDTTSLVDDVDAMALTPAGAAIRTLRDQHHADHVALIRYWRQGLSQAYVTQSVDATDHEYYAARAFSSIRNDCFNQGLQCFAHELGHILGAQHNPEASFAEDGQFVRGLFPDSHGYSFTATDSDGSRNCFGTMMSYRCTADRIAYFSDPSRQFLQIPVGVTDKRNNARAINAAKRFAANFRQSR